MCGLWYQHDRAPAHFCVPIRNCLDILYTGSWIGRGGPVLWPPQLPDLTTLDFFLWSHLKELVYREKVTTETDVVARLNAACTSVDTIFPLAKYRYFIEEQLLRLFCILWCSFENCSLTFVLKCCLDCSL